MIACTQRNQRVPDLPKLVIARPPLANGANGDRDTRGRFAIGNPGGPGSPHVKRVAQLRRLIMDTVSEEDVREIVAKLVEKAKAGDLECIRELLNRLVGKPQGATDVDRADVEAAELELSRYMAELTARATPQLPSL